MQASLSGHPLQHSLQLKPSVDGALAKGLSDRNIVILRIHECDEMSVCASSQGKGNPPPATVMSGAHIPLATGIAQAVGEGKQPLPHPDIGESLPRHSGGAGLRSRDRP